MISIRAYNKYDLLLIKGHLLTFVVCLFLVAGIFWGANYIDNSAAAELQLARSQVDSVRNSIAEIQSNEVTARQYKEQYFSLQKSGVLGAEDRLQLLELLAHIRTQHDLFPISINIGEQAELTLPYENTPDGTGKPIKLRSSAVELSFSLLHEEDLARLLAGLLGSANFLQPATCGISVNNESNTTFYYLDKHLTASCSMYWYTFNVAAAEAQP